MMSSHSQLWLLVTLPAVAAAAYSFYIPQLTAQSLQGRVTATTFILENPQCVFNQTSTNNVWLIVANNTVQLDTNQLVKNVPYSSFSSTGYYRTLNTIESSFPCNNIPSYIRVGGESVCSNSANCNGPLTSPGPYRVTFVVLDANSVLVGQTGWSGLITLRQGKASSAIDTWPGRRSGGMIVITSILSVLLATFLLCLIGTFIVGRKNIICCKKTEKIQPPVAGPLHLKNFSTHHAPSNADDLYTEPMA